MKQVMRIPERISGAKETARTRGPQGVFEEGQEGSVAGMEWEATKSERLQLFPPLLPLNSLNPEY